MTNYFKVYLEGKNGTTKYVLKKSEDVKKLLNEANQKDYYGYTVIKRLKQSTDIPVATGTFNRGHEPIKVNGLDTDWRIVGNNVVNWDRYKKSQGDER